MHLKSTADGEKEKKITNNDSRLMMISETSTMNFKLYPCVAPQLLSKTEFAPFISICWRVLRKWIMEVIS